MIIAPNNLSSKGKISNILSKKIQGDAGLANMGNTCFMNSSLQLLLHIGPLVNYFLSGQFSQDLNPKSPTKASRDAVAPVELQQAVGHFAPYLMDYSQQDCQEFLRFVLDGLAEDLKRSPTPKKNSPVLYEKHPIGAFSPGFDSIETSPSKLSCVDKLRLATNANNHRSVRNNNDTEIDDLNEIISKKMQTSITGNQESPNSTNGMLTVKKLETTPIKVNVTPVSVAAPAETLKSPEELALIAWKDYVEKNNSVITDIFAGQLQSTIECLECGHKSFTFDPFLDISVPIPRVMDESTGKPSVKASFTMAPNTASKITPWRIRSANSSISVDPTVAPKSNPVVTDAAVAKCTLEECLQIFTAKEILEDENTYLCEKCNVRRKCSKTLKILKYPKVLVIHINRFRYSQLVREKIATDVTFPISGLNLAPFLQSNTADQQPLEECTVNSQVSDLKNVGEDDPTYSIPTSPIRINGGCKAGDMQGTPLYDLAGVSHHSGSMLGGHYIAHINVHSDKPEDPSTWMCFNDARVSNIQPINVSGPSAYVLFYHLRDSSMEKTM